MRSGESVTSDLTEDSFRESATGRREVEAHPRNSPIGLYPTSMTLEC